MAFPQSPLDLRVELNLAGTWTDVSAYAYQRAGTQSPIAINRGRPDETSKATAGGANVELNNRDGRFSPKNPTGPYYGQLGRNTPMRLSVPAQGNYLRLEALNARAFVGNDSNLAISGSIDVRVQLQLTDWQGTTLAGKWDNGGCWVFSLNANGTLGFLWADSGAVQHSVNSTLPVPFTRSQQCLRVTMDATTGNVTFSTSATIGGTFTTLGAVSSGTGGAATSILVASGSALAVGHSFNILSGGNLYGRVYECQVYNGIGGSGGTLAADGIFSAQSAGTTSWTDAQGNPWQLSSGAEISGRDYRWHGETSSLPPRWDNTGTDIAVQVTSGGLLRRLGQGNAPIQSPMRRGIALQSGTLAPAQYWPCEDASSATSFGSATGGALLGFDGSPKLASDSSFPGSAPLPQLNGSRFFGRVPTYSSNGAIVVRALVHPGSSGTAGTPIIQVTTTGSCTALTAAYQSATNLSYTGTAGATSVFNSGSANFGANLPGGTIQQPLWMSLELTPGGGSTVNWALTVLPLTATVGVTSNGTFTGSIGNVTTVYVNPSAVFTDWVVGHVSVQSAWTSLFSLNAPFNGWLGEPAGQRFARVLGENGLTARVLGAAAVTAPMGVQPVDTLSNVLQQCEDADRGMIYEPRQVLGLAYRTLASMLDQSPSVVLDYSQATLGGTGAQLEPTYDDQFIKNDETVTRGSSGSGSTRGATFQYQLNDGSSMSISQPPNGIGDYTNSDTINCQLDSQVPHLASWIVHAGTADVARWPAIPLNLARNAIQANSLYYPLLGLDVGDYLQLVNMLGVITADPVSVIIPGTRESLGGYHHELSLNAVPESPFEVVVLNDAVRSRCDTDGSQLATAVTSAVTTLQVMTTGPSGILWTTAAGDLPVDIAVGGERMTVTAIAAQATVGIGIADGTFETGVSGWTAGDGTLVQSGSQHHSGSFSAQVTVIAAASQATLRPNGPNFVPVVAGQSYTCTLWVDAGVSGETFFAAIDWYGASGYMSTSAGTAALATAFVWKQYTVTANAPAGATSAVYGPTLQSPTGPTQYFYCDDVTFTTPAQAFTVTRSVNGVVKAQAALADVRLWTPPILSLI